MMSRNIPLTFRGHVGARREGLRSKNTLKICGGLWSLATNDAKNMSVMCCINISLLIETLHPENPLEFSYPILRIDI